MGGADLLEFYLAIEEQRKNILAQLSPARQDKAKYIFGIFDEISKRDNAFLHAFFPATAVLLFLFPNLIEHKLNLNLLLIPLISVLMYKTIYKICDFYFAKKTARLSKELANKMDDDPEVKDIFWHIRERAHANDFMLASLVWKVGISSK